ncbi:hypothetical protein QZM52_05250 [Burkholderia metallica]|uniref:Uncharacterized protein n=1 Tax=Burkholderia metallica TaxID=488729 RepID=A0ABT8P6J6_9BURK|nr:hypothetical protein [Burkholderia metallica]MDN7930697.1 hypothetical protein [Burkholderia metallica]
MSNTNQQTETTNLADHQAPASLAQTITTLQTRYTGAHNALYEALRDIYGAHHTYFLNAVPEQREQNLAALNQAFKDSKIGTTEQTTDLHKLVKLVVTVNPQLTSGYVHVFSVAQALNTKPDQFLLWLKEAGGIETVRKKFLADGKLNPNYESGSKREKNRAGRIANARNALQTACVTIDALALADATLDPVANPTEYVAIVVRNPDGSIGIKGFVSNKTLLDSAYLEHAAEQTQKTTPNISGTSIAAVIQVAAQAPAISSAEDFAALADALSAV